MFLAGLARFGAGRVWLLFCLPGLELGRLPVSLLLLLPLSLLLSRLKHQIQALHVALLLLSVGIWVLVGCRLNYNSTENHSFTIDTVSCCPPVGTRDSTCRQ